MFEIEDLFGLTVDGAFSSFEEFQDFANQVDNATLFSIIKPGAFADLQEFEASFSQKKKKESGFITQDQDGGLVTEDISSDIPVYDFEKPQTEQDFFEGTFGDILRSFDKFTQTGLGDFIDDMARSAATGYYQGQVAEDASDILLRGTDATEEDILSFIEANKEAQKLGPSDEMMAYQKTYEENGKGFMGVIMGLAKSGLQVIPEVILSSITSMATNKDSLVAAGTILGAGATVGGTTGAAGGTAVLPIVGTVTGAAGGAIAGAAATLPYAFAAAGSVLEMGATFSELLQEEIEGELTPEKIREAISNEEIYTSIRNKALARGITIGVIDAFTGRLGGKVAGGILSKAGKGATKGTKIKSVLAASGIESVGGSIGESAGIGVTNIDLLGKTKGQEFDISEIALEGIAEAPGGIKDVISARFSKPKYKVNGKKVDVETIDNLIETMTLDQLQSTKIKIDNDYEGRAKKLSDRILQLNTQRLILDANPDINPETLSEITSLQLELNKLEGNKTEVAKEKASIIKAKIKDLQENQLEAEVDTEVDAFRELEQSEQLKYIEQASKELVEESEAKGDEEFEITEQQNLERAVELFNKDQQTETEVEVTSKEDTEVKEERLKDSQIPVSNQRFTVEDDNGNTSFVEITTNLDGSRKLIQRIEDGTIVGANSKIISKDNTLTNEEYTSQQFGDIKQTEDVDIKNIRNPKLESKMSDRQRKAAGMDVTPEAEVEVTSKEKTEVKEERYKDSQIPVSQQNITYEDGNGETRIATVTTQLDGSRKVQISDEEGDVFFRETISKDNTLTNEEYVSVSTEGDVKSTEDVNIKTVINPKLESGMSDRQRKAAGMDVTPEAEVDVDDEVVYEMNKTNKRIWSKDFEILDNRQGQEQALFDEEGNKTSDKWWIVNKVTGQIIEVGTKAMAKDVIANAPAYAETFGDGTKVEANMLVTPAPKAEVKVEEQAEVKVDDEVLMTPEEITKAIFESNVARNKAERKGDEAEVKRQVERGEYLSSLIDEKTRKRMTIASDINSKDAVIRKIEEYKKDPFYNSNFLTEEIKLLEEVLEEYNKIEALENKKQSELNNKKKPKNIKVKDETSLNVIQKIEQRIKTIANISGQKRILNRLDIFKKSPLPENYKNILNADLELLNSSIVKVKDIMDMSFKKFSDYANKVNTTTIDNQIKEAKQKIDSYKKFDKIPVKPKVKSDPKTRKQVTKVEKQVDNARKALNKLDKDIKIVVHNDDASYRKATGEDTREQSTRGEYNPTTKTININATKVQDNTVAHEVFHALLLRNGITNKQAKAITDRMLKAVKKTASPELLQKLKEHSDNYDSALQSEESIAELFGILASEYKSLDKPTQNLVQRWINKLAKILGVKKFTDAEVIDLLNVVSAKVEAGQEITEQDVAILDKNKYVKNPAQFLSRKQDGDFEVVYTENEKISQYVKDGRITEPENLEEFRGNKTAITSPDDMVVGEIYFNGEKIFEGQGGLFFVTKFGDVWAAGDKTTATKLADMINRSVEANGGKGYLTLTKGTDKKLISSAAGVNSSLGIIDVLLTQNILPKSVVRTAVKKVIKEFGGGNVDLKGTSNQMVSQLREFFGDKKNATFEARGTVMERIITEIGKDKRLGDLKKKNSKLTKILGGDPSKTLVGGKTSKTANSLVDLIASLAAEQITKGLNTGDIYGVIEVDGKVEYYAGTHPSYPAHIRQVNRKPPTLHLPQNRPAAKDYLMRASNKIYKTPAVSPTEYGSFYELDSDKAKSDAPQSRKQKTKSDILKTLKEGQKLPTKPKQIKNKNGSITSGKVHLYHSTNGVENLNDILENGIDFEKQKAVGGLFFSKLGSPYRQDDSFVVIETDIENIPFNQRTEGQEVALGQLSDYKIVHSSKMSPRELKTLSSLEMILNRKTNGGIEGYEKSLQNYKKRNKNSELVKYLEDAPQSRKQKPNYKIGKINTPNTTINVVEGAGPDSFEIATKDYKATEGVKGSTIIGFVKNKDFPGEKKKETRGEVFILQVGDKGKGTGTSLMLDALRLMKENGTKTVKFTVPSKEGKPFNESLVRKGYINLLKVSDRTGTSEYEITDKVLDEDAPQSRKQKTIQQAARDFNMSETGFFPPNADSYFLKRAISRAEGDYGVKKARTGSFFLVDSRGKKVDDLFKRPQSRKQKPSKKPTRKRTSSIKKAITEIKNVLNITPDEQRKIFKALNDQKKRAKDIKKDIVASLRELTKEGKITPSKMVSVINKVPDDFNNPITVERFVEYMTKVFNNADYGNKMMIANAKKGKARKNASTKIGIAEGLVEQLQRLFSVKPSLIPDSVLDQYMELINIFGKRESVLSLPSMEQVTNLTEDVLQQLDEEQSMAIELADRYENADKVMGDDGVDYAATIKQMLDNEVITEREYEVMKKYKSEIKPTEPATPKTEEEIEAERQGVIEDINETKEVDPSVFPSRLERDLAKRFKKLLKTDAVNDLSLDDLKNLFKVIDNINNGYLPHYAQIMVGKMNAINDAKLGANAINRSKLLPLSKIYANLKSKFGKTGKTPTSELQRRNPTFYIDQIFGDFKTQDIFNSIFKRSAEASAKYTKAIKEVQAKIEKVEQAVLKSFGREPNKAIMSKYKQMSYLIQQEFLSNPDSKQVNSVEDFLKATIKRIKTETTSYTETDAIMLQEILDKYTDNGKKPFDIDQLYESFNVAERNSIRALEEINKSMTEKAVYTANIIRGNKITPLKNYTHLSVIPDVSKADIIETETSQISDMFNKYLKPSTKAKSLIERTGKVSPLNFDVYASVQRGAKYTLMDFNLTEPIRTARRTINQIEKNLSDKDGNMPVNARRKFNAIRDASVEHIENLLSNALTQNTLADQTIDYIQKQGYRAILAGVPRASYEFLANVLGAIFFDPSGLITGIKNRKILATPEAKDIMNNLNSTQTNRLFSTGLSGKFVDTGILNQAAGVTASKAKGKVQNTILKFWNKTGQRWIKGVEFTADSLISAPDKLVMQPMWFGAFENRFKQLTGKSPDFDKIATNDEAYMDKYATELNDAKTLADNRSVYVGATDNAFMGILKGTVKPNQGALLRGFNAFNGFMTRFLIFEYITARTGIMAAVGNGQINKRQGAALLAGVTTRMMAYTFMGNIVAESIKGLTEDDEEEDYDFSNFQFEDDDEQGMKSIDKMLGQAMLSAFTSLALGRDFGNATKSIINLGIEDLNERYGQFLRNGEYDKYRDAIQYTIIPEGKNGRLPLVGDVVPNLFAAYSPMIKTLVFGLNKIFESDRVEPDAIERQQDERFIRLPLETFGVLGFIPFYKDIRKIVLGDMYKGLRKAKKDAANKKKRKAEMLQGYSSETDMKRYDFSLWERTFGPDSPGYETRQAEKELRRKERKLRQQKKDKMYDYTPSKKKRRKQSSPFGPSSNRKGSSPFGPN